MRAAEVRITSLGKLVTTDYRPEASINIKEQINLYGRDRLTGQLSIVVKYKHLSSIAHTHSSGFEQWTINLQSPDLQPGCTAWLQVVTASQSPPHTGSRFLMKRPDSQMWCSNRPFWGMSFTLEPTPLQLRALLCRNSPSTITSQYLVDELKLWDNS